MASRVSAKGKRIEAFPEIPKGAPKWDGRVAVRTPLKREEQPALADRLIIQKREGNVPQIFLGSVFSNKGRHDGRSIAAAAAALYYRGSEWGHTVSILGEKLTQADIEVEALRPALNLLRDFANETKYTGPIQVITGSPSAPGKFLDFSPHPTQHVSLEFAHQIDSFVSENPGVFLTILYAKRNPTLEGFKRSRQLALEAVKRPLTYEYQAPSIHYQRAETRATAIGAWEQRYHENPRHSQAYNSALVTSG